MREMKRELLGEEDEDEQRMGRERGREQRLAMACIRAEWQ